MTEQKKSRHHYVPKFYLRRFSVNEHQIHLINVEQQKRILAAKLKTQCQTNKLYGQTNELEDVLMAYEGMVATTFRHIDANGKVLPTDLLKVLYFATQTQLRSPRLLEQLTYGAQKQIDHLVRVNGYSEKHSPRVTLESGPAMAQAFQSFAKSIFLSFDLKPILLVSETGSFITSDYPVVKNNSIFVSDKYMGSNGWLAQGLQVFIPLSPHKVILLYDERSYGTSEDVVEVDSQTVKNINHLQILNCISNIYFHDQAQIKEIDLRYATHQFRRLPRPVVEYTRDAQNPLVYSMRISEVTKNLRIVIPGQKVRTRQPTRLQPVPFRLDPSIAEELSRHWNAARGAELEQEPGSPTENSAVSS